MESRYFVSIMTELTKWPQRWMGGSGPAISLLGILDLLENASSSLAKDHIVVETNYVVTSDNLRK